MQRKAYVSGVTALLAVLLAGCTGDSGGDDNTDPKPGDTATATTEAQPGRYRTLPEPCGAVSQGTLDSLLPGIRQVTDEEQREKAYEGTATPTYDTDRKVGCRWKVESRTATDHLLVDFERVVSYDNAVSDDDRATELYVEKEAAADLPEPSVSPSDEGSGEASPDGESAANPSSEESGASDGASATPSDSSSASTSTGASAGAGSSATSTPAALQPRLLDDLGDEAFLDDALSGSQQRTVTVVFRTSNVIVTIQYDEQPTSTTDVPSSEEMQDRARKLAGQLAETFTE
ncbi:DUF3558 domain-containing protein [Streptomyces sp. NPDC050704]|uniref:DUF3558 domain-containing protein n=1 Tax=Streptomyces sp. NPDC050704 TaxID=3157219 RepID=UPI0034215EDC